MKRIITLLAVTGILAGAETAFSQDTVQLDEGIAAEVMRGSLNRQSASAIINNDQLRQSYETLAVEQHLAAEAARRGLSERIDVQQNLINARRKILIGALRQSVARQAPEATEKDIKKFYKETPSRWTLPEAYQLDAVELDPDEKSNMRRAASMVTGEPVSDPLWQTIDGRMVATQQSGQWVTENQLAQRIWDALPMMKYGAVRLFVVGDSRLLVRKGAHREARLLPLEEVENQVRQTVQAQLNEDAWQAYLNEVREGLQLGSGE